VPEFAVNPHRTDPYKNFKFRVKWDGKYVAGVSSVSPLLRITEVISYRSGSQPSLIREVPGRTRFEPITLERGVTHDTEFEEWANKVWRLGAGLGSEVALANYRKDIIIELLNEAGQVVKAYLVYRCWPSEYQALPQLDANGPEVAIEKLVLHHEGWERDESVTEPAEPKS
jgi:phage tail-like protein